MYQNLSTNLPKEVMAFPDFPFASQEKSFLHHTEVQQPGARNYEYSVVLFSHIVGGAAVPGAVCRGT